MRHSSARLAALLRAQAEKHGVRLELVQLDYLLTWLLASIAAHPILGRDLVFKGGTALKKCYFGNYRFSEDLDFTALPSAPSGEALRSHIDAVVRQAERAMNEHGPISLVWNPYQEREPHPDGQEAFRVRAQFPGQREPLIAAMIEITFSEMVLFEPEQRSIIHPYGEPSEQAIKVYSLDEVCLEKLRGILQHTKKLHERGWTRSRTRDYYDLHRLFSVRPDLLASSRIVPHLRQKCSAKGVGFTTVDDFFDVLFVR